MLKVSDSEGVKARSEFFGGALRVSDVLNGLVGTLTGPTCVSVNIELGSIAAFSELPADKSAWAGITGRVSVGAGDQEREIEVVAVVPDERGGEDSGIGRHTAVLLDSVLSLLVGRGGIFVRVLLGRGDHGRFGLVAESGSVQAVAPGNGLSVADISAPGAVGLSAVAVDPGDRGEAGGLGRGEVAVVKDRGGEDFVPRAGADLDAFASLGRAVERASLRLALAHLSSALIVQDAASVGRD